MLNPILLKLAALVGGKVREQFEGRRGPRYTIAASGSGCGMHWAAVPLSSCAGFRGDFPGALTAEKFLEVVAGWRHSKPDYYRAVLPLAGEVVEAVERYGHCQVFVLSQG